MINILVLCTGNSCRSQMAEGFLKQYARDKAKVYSAGIESHGLNPRAVLVMQEVGIDISNQTSDQLDQYLDQSFDFVITVCDNANESCPVFPGGGQKLHQNFPDPAKATGTEAEILDSFRYTRDLVKDYCDSFVKQHF